jgi:hypothetical protein
LQGSREDHERRREKKKKGKRIGRRHEKWRARGWWEKREKMVKAAKG